MPCRTEIDHGSQPYIQAGCAHPVRTEESKQKNSIVGHEPQGRLSVNKRICNDQNIKSTTEKHFVCSISPAWFSGERVLACTHTCMHYVPCTMQFSRMLTCERLSTLTVCTGTRCTGDIHAHTSLRTSTTQHHPHHDEARICAWRVS